MTSLQHPHYHNFFAMKLIRKALCALLLFAYATASASGEKAVSDLMERLAPGMSKLITVSIAGKGTSDGCFELSQHPSGPHIEASDPISAAVGLNWYLKHRLHATVTWDHLTVELPDTLPPVGATVRRSARLPLRYYLNYCTHSYSTAYWDWERWQREIDWMALHGINMPLAVTGCGMLWRNVLRRLGYPDDAIRKFIPSPAWQAWWLMNNLEGMGGPVSDSSLKAQADLQRRILARMRELGMQPVLPGYSGMVPHDASQTLGINVTDPGLWCGFVRPAFLSPDDPSFARIADIYYEELTRLYGTSRYYSTDPFHEGGNTEGVDLAAAGRAIIGAMKRANPEAVWVAQGWQENPRTEILRSVAAADLIVLDLQTENRPMWSTREGGFHGHPWIFCELLNFGGNQGLYGRLSGLVEGYYKALAESPLLCGVGLTPEGIDNNSMMYELLLELPWLAEPLETAGALDRWLADYAVTRYGAGGTTVPREAVDAWLLLARSVYSCPKDSAGQGARESLFCARPGFGLRTASTWAASTDYYDPAQVRRADSLMAIAEPALAGNPHFRYDRVDIRRQVLADSGRLELRAIDRANAAADSVAFRRHADRFLRLILEQDSLLATHPLFTLDYHLDMARRAATTDGELTANPDALLLLYTLWGPADASEKGQLRDYANREYSGLLRLYYYPRWQRFLLDRDASGYATDRSLLDTLRAATSTTNY